MPPNEEVIRRFYSAFQVLDYKTMNDCYSEDIVFSDPVFMLLRGDEVRAMWEMLCKNAKDFSLQFSNIELLDHEYATCQWTASYTFSKTGNRVVNNIKAFMRLADGKIIYSTFDGYSMYSVQTLACAPSTNFACSAFNSPGMGSYA